MPAGLRRSNLIVLGASVVTLWAPASVHAQIIPIRTVPLATGEQFLLLPSRSLSMGGVGLAIDDTLSDAWSNPAKGAQIRESSFIGSPTFYSISDGGGGGRSLPVAGMFTGARWFAGAALALQQVEDATGNDIAIWNSWVGGWQQPRRLTDVYGRNLYASMFSGVRLGGGWSVGLGLSASALDAMDGVDLLYAGASRIEQSGGTQDVQVGVHKQGATDQLSLLLLHSRVSMTHDVTYVEWRWDSLAMRTVFRERVELNEDRTRTWGAHLEWARALAAPGWRMGASTTLNYKSHPKIPNYEIQNIPRDPGTTWGFEGALGFARASGPATFAFEVAFQPIWSETWQEADSQAVADSDSTLAIGDRSIENEFFFTNIMLRTGISHEVGRATFQAGVEVRSYDYALEQVNNVLDTYREQDETWMEWTPTLGAIVRFSGFDLYYAARITTGTGQPSTRSQGFATASTVNQIASDFIIAPQGPLSLQPARVATHQLAVRMPMR